MILFPFQTDDWHALAKTAMEDVRRAEAAYYAQKRKKEKEAQEKEQSEWEAILPLILGITERHRSLSVIQDLVHREDAFIWNRIFNLDDHA